MTVSLSPVIYPLFGHYFTFVQNVGLTIVFTVISMSRSYVVRRWADKHIQKLAFAIAALFVRKDKNET